MDQKLRNLSSKQKELLIKKLNLRLNLGADREDVERKTEIIGPFGYHIPVSHFGKAMCKSYEIAPPGPHQVQIKAKAISLNFRDLMIGLGLYPRMEGIPANMGGDYAGVIVACGEGVEDFKIGDAVIALHGGDEKVDYHFCSVINVFTAQVIAKPSHLTFQEACCIPTVFLTAYLGLCSLGNLAQGERVLIHTASGGVGLAAIQIAKWRQAEIFATAGSEEKRAFLRSIGIEYVMNSRSLEFYDQILEKTQGIGVDLILNTIAGKALEVGMQLLNTLGRFIQLDKTDITQKRLIDLGLFKKSTSLIFLDLSQFYGKPKLQRIFQEVCDLFRSRIFSSLPFKLFAHSEIPQALNFMALGKNIGKIVLDFEQQ